MPPEKQLLKIAELSDVTGVPKDSIRYYVKEGLLPAPRKTSRNMAYYEAETYVPRIRLIKELQERRFLPLRVIKDILSADGGPTTVEELDTLSALDGKLFRTAPADVPREPMRRAAVAARTQVPEERLREYERIGLLTPRTQNGEVMYDPIDIRLVEAIAEIRTTGFRPETGFPADNYRIYQETMETLARKELGFFAHGVTGRISPDRAVQMAERGIILINRLLGILREKSLLKLLHEYRMEMEGGNQRIPRARVD